MREFSHNGNTYTEYLLNKRDSLILVAQNCPEFTARIVDRWQELEVQVSSGFQVPQTFAQALMLAAQQAETGIHGSLWRKPRNRCGLQPENFFA